jgi:hypothetical protein
VLTWRGTASDMNKLAQASIVLKTVTVSYVTIERREIFREGFYVWLRMAPNIFLRMAIRSKDFFVFLTLRRAYIGTEILYFNLIIRIFENKMADSDKISTCSAYHDEN